MRSRNKPPKIEITSLSVEDRTDPSARCQTVAEFTLIVPPGLSGEVEIKTGERASIWPSGRKMSKSDNLILDEYKSIVWDINHHNSPNIAKLSVKKVNHSIPREVKCALVCLGEHPKEIVLRHENRTVQKYPLGEVERIENPVMKFVRSLRPGRFIHPKQVATNRLIKDNLEPVENVEGSRIRVLYSGSDDCANLLSSYRLIREIQPTGVNISYTIALSLNGNDLMVNELIGHFNETSSRTFPGPPKIIQHEEDIGDDKFDCIIETFTLPWAVKNVKDLKSLISNRKRALRIGGKWILVVPEKIGKEPFYVDEDTEFWEDIFRDLKDEFGTPDVVKCNTFGWCYEKKKSDDKGSEELSKLSQQHGSAVVKSFQEFCSTTQAWGASQRTPARAAPTTVMRKIDSWLERNKTQDILLVYGESGWGKTSSVASCLFPTTTTSLEIFLTQGEMVEDEITPPESPQITSQRGGPLVVIDEIHRFKSDWSELKTQLNTTKGGRFILVGKKESNPTLFEDMVADMAAVYSVDVTDLNQRDYKEIIEGIAEAKNLSSDTYDHILEVLKRGTSGGLNPRLLVSRIQGKSTDLAELNPVDVDGWANVPLLDSTGSFGMRFGDQATLFGINNPGGI